MLLALGLDLADFAGEVATVRRIGAWERVGVRSPIDFWRIGDGGGVIAGRARGGRTARGGLLMILRELDFGSAVVGSVIGSSIVGRPSSVLSFGMDNGIGGTSWPGGGRARGVVGGKFRGGGGTIGLLAGDGVSD
jgi:hypothetical protein